MSSLLSEELLGHIGRRSEPNRQLVTRRDIRKYAIATNNRQRKYLDGEVAPPMFHLALFWDVVELGELSADGVSIDRLLPTFPLKRAMAGGLKIEYRRAVKPGDWLTATRTLSDIYQKDGSSGPLLFYRVDMDIVNDEGQSVIYEQTTRILR